MKLSISLLPSALTTPILSGICEIEGIAIEPHEAKTVDGNSRRMLDLAFDVGEMSLATFVRAREAGAPLIGIPVFTGRRFLQPGIGIRPSAAIAGPDQLAGKRVGMPQFWMTSSVWHRAVLRRMYAVDQDAVTWVTVQRERFDDIEFPPGARIESLDGATLPDLMREGRIDAVLFPRPIEAHFDTDVAQCPFDDIVAAQRDFHARTDMFPIMHFVVMREELHDRHQDLAGRILEAFQRAKQTVLADPATVGARDLPLHGADLAAAIDLLGEDPWPYGVADNANVLRWFLQSAHEQGLTRARVEVESLFARTVI